MIRKTLALLRLENNYHHIHNPIHCRRNYGPFRCRRTQNPVRSRQNHHRYRYDRCIHSLCLTHYLRNYDRFRCRRTQNLIHHHLHDIG